VPEVTGQRGGEGVDDVGQPVATEIGPVSGPVVKAWRATAAGYSDDELRLLLEFQGKLEEIMRGQLARLRGDDAGRWRGLIPRSVRPKRRTEPGAAR
jgi:hypothetical protein